VAASSSDRRFQCSGASLAAVRAGDQAAQQVFRLHLSAFERGTASLADVYGNEFAFIWMCHSGDRVDVHSNCKIRVAPFLMPYLVFAGSDGSTPKEASPNFRTVRCKLSVTATSLACIGSAEYACGRTTQ
jgi:hypothetical protein